jgi:NTE family protein
MPVPGPVVHHVTRKPVANSPKRLVLTDGGVYDNLGLQAVESFHTVLASDGGAPLDYGATLRTNWFSQSLRTVHLIDGQVRALRRRHFVRELTKGERLGALWTIATDIGDYPAPDKLPVDADKAAELASVPTRLGPVSRIIWGSR